MLIDPSVIVPRLRVTIENLFQANNQLVYLGGACPTVGHLTFQMGNRLHQCIDNLGEIVQELEPKKVNIGCLTLEDALTLEGYAEIRRGLIKSWQFIEAREQAIISRQ